MEDTMTQEQYREAVKSGVNPYEEGAQEDAAPNSIEDDTPNEDMQEGERVESEEQQDSADTEEYANDDIPDNQKDAFYKRVQRERKKAYEEAQAKVREELEAQYNPYKTVFERIGLSDPQQALQMIEQQQIKQEADRLAYENGWSDEQTQMYVRQQDLERKQTDMAVSLRIYELADTPDYPGIKQMKGAITEFVRANPRVPVDQAYWAVGGPQLAQQLKREAEQREIAKRSQTKRTVVSDSPTDNRGPEPLPPEAVQFMRRTGMSEAQVRMMLKDEGPKNLDDYRKMNKKG